MLIINYFGSKTTQRISCSGSAPQATVIRAFLHNFSEGLLKIFTALSKLKCPALLNKDSGRTGAKFQHGALLEEHCPTAVAAQPGTIQGVQEHLMPLRPHVTAEAQTSAPYPHQTTIDTATKKMLTARKAYYSTVKYHQTQQLCVTLS